MYYWGELPFVTSFSLDVKAIFPSVPIPASTSDFFRGILVSAVVQAPAHHWWVYFSAFVYPLNIRNFQFLTCVSPKNFGCLLTFLWVLQGAVVFPKKVWGVSPSPHVVYWHRYVYDVLYLWSRSSLDLKPSWRFWTLGIPLLNYWIHDWSRKFSLQFSWPY